jgi:hypothetical protein
MARITVPEVTGVIAGGLGKIVLTCKAVVDVTSIGVVASMFLHTCTAIVPA